MAKKKEKRPTVGRTWPLLLGLTLAGVGGLGALGWHWSTTIVCHEVDVTGTRHADRDELLKLTRVDTGMVLFDLDPRLLEDRLLRHPWVKAADVTRLPTGTLTIQVEERIPVVLALDAAGSPARYLDRAGFPMPLVKDAVYDVPLLRGLTLHPVQPVDHPVVRPLLEALAVLDAETDALVSEVEIRPPGEAWILTAPAGPYGAIPVRLGRSGFPQKLARLKAFWHQAVLTRPEVRFKLVDLRFDSQVVTQEDVAHRP